MTFFRFIGLAIVAGILYLGFSYLTLPDIRKINSCFTTSMNKVYLCPKSPNYATLDEISPNIKNAIIISEDASFYSHHGFDFDEIQNSLKANITKASFARGGSTISQQLIKNLFLSKDKSLLRKLKEIILTQRMEEKFSKNTILEKYLNVVELGDKIYGVKAGAQYYFKKSPAIVNPLEAAFLALLLPNPEKYSVSFKKKELTPFARKRAKDILYKMSYYKKITPEEYANSINQLETFFKPIPQMEDEPSQQELDQETYDMTEMDQIKQQQNDSIQKLEEPAPQTEEQPEAPAEPQNN